LRSNPCSASIEETPRRLNLFAGQNRESLYKEPTMPIKEHEYVKQTLERYTNCSIEDFCDHIVITNFKRYIMRFKEKTKGAYTEGNFRIVNAKDINCTMIDFGIGSPQAALVINCLAYLENLKTVIMLGMCGGIDDVLEEGDFIVPSAAIRGEGASNDYLPPEFPAIPASSVNLYCIGAVRQIGLTPRCGIIYTTDRRLWEFDAKFVDYLRNKRILAIDMELATLFSVAYHYAVPIGSIMLVSDMPLQRRGIKDKKKQDQVFLKYMETHLDLALDAVKNMEKKWSDVKRQLSSEW
jgi:AMP nucleosidase